MTSYAFEPEVTFPNERVTMCLPSVHRATRVLPLEPHCISPGKKTPKNPATPQPCTLGFFLFGTAGIVKAKADG